MGSMEIVLLATKGKPKRIVNNIKQLVISERTAHSKKPDIVRQRIVELMGDLPRVELFARGHKNKDMFDFNRFDGWDTFGNESENSIVLKGRENFSKTFLPQTEI
jgi:N6-adenosine-specific RNA methylase IME4